ncbi:hypothetical protein INT44_007040 [Umbelopsis vinacea]|uniref:Uncharacterized protein n=1 Tax=Umbelopsis vinacea TaxID=44442 RepID=A0A8H7PFM2_9FUNG|nr:hypothetical protein INT44_007040 [Umbelopsis vinacea]
MTHWLRDDFALLLTISSARDLCVGIAFLWAHIGNFSLQTTYLPLVHMAADTPVSDVIKSLQEQVEELKMIAAEYQNGTTSKHVDDATPAAGVESTISLQQELQELKVKYDKANYRIEMLCRALDEKDFLLKSMRKA